MRRAMATAEVHPTATSNPALSRKHPLGLRLNPLHYGQRNVLTIELDAICLLIFDRANGPTVGSSTTGDTRKQRSKPRGKSEAGCTEYGDEKEDRDPEMSR